MLKRIFYHQRRNLKRLVEIWEGRYPPRRLAPITFLEQCLMASLLIAELISVCQTLKWALFPKRPPARKRERGPTRSHIGGGHYRRCVVDVYAVGGLLVLIGLLWLAPHLWNDSLRGHAEATWRKVAACLVYGGAIYIMAEMLINTLKVQIVHVYDKENAPKSANRSIVLLLIGYLQIAVGFAILYIAGRAVATDIGKPAMHDAGTAFYFSYATIATVGYGDFKPITIGGQRLVMIEIGMGLVMTVFLLSRFMSLPPGAWGSNATGPRPNTRHYKRPRATMFRGGTRR